MAGLPIDLSFLRSVDISEIDSFIVEKDIHIIEKKLMRIGVGNVQAEMIYQLFLLFLPFLPAVFADLGPDLLPQLGRNRRIAERFVLLPALRAFKFV